MKKHAVLFSIFFLPSFFFLIASCDPPLDCNCTSVDGLFFRTTGLQVDFVDNNVGVNVQMISDSAEVQQANLLTKLQFDVEYYNTAENTPIFDWYALTNSAYACECATNGQSGSNEKISALNITTIYDIDANHPAGSNINDLVILSQFSNEIAFADLPMIELYSESFDVKFTEQLPAGKFSINAVMEMKDGTIYTAQSAVIKLK